MSKNMKTFVHVLKSVMLFAVIFLILCMLFDKQLVITKSIQYDEFIEKVSNNSFSKYVVQPNNNKVYAYSNNFFAYVLEVLNMEEVEDFILKNKTIDFEYSVKNSKGPSIGWLIIISIVVGSLILVCLSDEFKKKFNEKKSLLPEFYDDDEDDDDDDFFIPEPIQNIKTRFSDVIGLKDQLDEFRDIVSFLKEPEKYRKMNAEIPKGVLFYGAPGTGKTLIARAIAGEADVPFFYVSASQLQSKYIGESEKNIRKLFNAAKNEGLAIIFIDELDSIAAQRYSEESNKYMVSTINQLLTCMDGFEETNGVIVIAATNNKEALDSAILRRGRFDRQIYIPLPDKSVRKQMVEYYIKDKQLDVESVTEFYDYIASITTGFSGSDIKTLINEATIMAVRSGRNVVQYSDLNESYRKIIVGIKNSTAKYNKDEKWLTAVHEVGHAIVSRLLGKTPFEISIICRDTSGGYNLTANEDEIYNSIESIYNEIKVSLAGRAAERVIIGTISSGASGDLVLASEMLYEMYLEYGMGHDTEVSLVLTSNDDMNSLLVESSLESMSDDINRLYEEVVELLTSHKEIIEKLATTLCDVETLNRSALETFFVENGI